jgi:hypothetical protein
MDGRTNERFFTKSVGRDKADARGSIMHTSSCDIISRDVTQCVTEQSWTARLSPDDGPPGDVPVGDGPPDEHPDDMV